MNRIVLPLPVTSPLYSLIRRLAEYLPAIGLLGLLDRMQDEDVEPWRRAAIATVVLEAAALVNVALPIALVVRFAVLNAAFNGQRTPRPNPADRGSAQSP